MRGPTGSTKGTAAWPTGPKRRVYGCTTSVDGVGRVLAAAAAAERVPNGIAQAAVSVAAATNDAAQRRSRSPLGVGMGPLSSRVVVVMAAEVSDGTAGREVAHAGVAHTDVIVGGIALHAPLSRPIVVVVVVVFIRVFIIVVVVIYEKRRVIVVRCGGGVRRRVLSSKRHFKRQRHQSPRTSTAVARGHPAICMRLRDRVLASCLMMVMMATFRAPGRPRPRPRRGVLLVQALELFQELRFGGH